MNVTPNRTNEKISDTPLNDDICQRRSFRVRPKSSKNGSKIFVPNRPMKMKRPSSSGAIMQTPIYFPEMVIAKGKALLLCLNQNHFILYYFCVKM